MLTSFTYRITPTPFFLPHEGPLRNIGILYNISEEPDEEKPLTWMGSSYRDLVDFPEPARRAAGHNLGRVQNGIEPEDWKPMESIGAGVYEIRVTTIGGGCSIQHRVFYVAKFDEAVYVLHAFEKKTQKTSRHDVEVGRARYRQMLQLRREASQLTKR
jgi:phage-related protein